MTIWSSNAKRRSSTTEHGLQSTTPICNISSPLITFPMTAIWSIATSLLAIPALHIRPLQHHKDATPSTTHILGPGRSGANDEYESNLSIVSTIPLNSDYQPSDQPWSHILSLFSTHPYGIYSENRKHLGRIVATEWNRWLTVEIAKLGWKFHDQHKLNATLGNIQLDLQRSLSTDNDFQTRPLDQDRTTCSFERSTTGNATDLQVSATLVPVFEQEELAGVPSEGNSQMTLGSAK